MVPKIWKSACFATCAFKSKDFVQILENFARTCVRVSVRFISSAYFGTTSKKFKLKNKTKKSEEKKHYGTGGTIHIGQEIQCLP